MDNLNLYQDYINLLMEVKDKIEQLSELARRKIDAVRNDDLMELNEVMKQEQVLSLSVRGLEKRRSEMLSRLGLSDVPLSGLAEHYPEDVRYEAKEKADDLLRQYEVYKTYSNAARNTLEVNLHEIEKYIEEHGGEAQAAASAAYGTGIGVAEPEPPQAMKTDFRA